MEYNKEPDAIQFPKIEPEVEEVEYVVLRKEPQPLQMPTNKTVKATLYIKLVGVKVPLDVIEWIMSQHATAGYDFTRYDTHVVIDYQGDGEPPKAWKKKP